MRADKQAIDDPRILFEDAAMCAMRLSELSAECGVSCSDMREILERMSEAANEVEGDPAFRSWRASVLEIRFGKRMARRLAKNLP